MFAVEQDTDDSLGCTGIINDLLGKENFVQSAVLNHSANNFFIWHPFEKKNESMNRPAMIFNIDLNIFCSIENV
jgi:hypothetical protein